MWHRLRQIKSPNYKIWWVSAMFQHSGFPPVCKYRAINQLVDDAIPIHRMPRLDNASTELQICSISDRTGCFRCQNKVLQWKWLLAIVLNHCDLTRKYFGHIFKTIRFIIIISIYYIKKGLFFTIIVVGKVWLYQL